jgi:hypothetical protein
VTVPGQVGERLPNPTAIADVVALRTRPIRRAPGGLPPASPAASRATGRVVEVLLAALAPRGLLETAALHAPSSRASRQLPLGGGGPRRPRPPACPTCSSAMRVLESGARGARPPSSSGDGWRRHGRRAGARRRAAGALAADGAGLLQPVTPLGGSPLCHASGSTRPNGMLARAACPRVVPQCTRCGVR